MTNQPGRFRRAFLNEIPAALFVSARQQFCKEKNAAVERAGLSYLSGAMVDSRSTRLSGGWRWPAEHVFSDRVADALMQHKSCYNDWMMLRKLGEKIIWSRAKEYVQRYKPDLIGVTGSFGKTFTKEAVALALSDERDVREARNSYNTPVGVALAILGLEAASTRMGWVRLLISSKKREIGEREPNTIVLELGADRPGDIEWLVQQVPFKIGVVTNIGSTHLRFFVNKDMVAHEKMSLPISLIEGGTAILNADDPLVLEMKDHIRVPAILYGKSSQADVQLVRAVSTGNQGMAGEIRINGRAYEINLPKLIAQHQVYSVLAAVAVVKALKGDIKKAINNLRHLAPPPGRLRLLAGVNNSTIIDDSYNAAPEAVVAALETLKKISGKRKIAILGDMFDLGPETLHWHKQIGQQISQFADIFVAVGENMEEAQAEVLKSSSIDTHHFDTSADAGKWIGSYVQGGDVVLVKGSRAMAMEKAVARLLANKEDKDLLVH